MFGHGVSERGADLLAGRAGLFALGGMPVGAGTDADDVEGDTAGLNVRWQVALEGLATKDDLAIEADFGDNSNEVGGTAAGR